VEKNLMNKKKLIKRPDWTISNHRKLDKLWLDKNENFYCFMMSKNADMSSQKWGENPHHRKTKVFYARIIRVSIDGF